MRRQTDLQFKCIRCSDSFEEEHSLIRHLARKHGVHKDEYVLEVKLGGVRPTCACGCGEETGFNFVAGQFNRFVLGHQSRMPDIKEKIVAGLHSTKGKPKPRKVVKPVPEVKLTANGKRRGRPPKGDKVVVPF